MLLPVKGMSSAPCRVAGRYIEMRVVIQSARMDDAAAIAGVHLASLRAAYQGLLPDSVAPLVLDPPDVKQRTRGWKRWLKRSQASTVVARVDGTVVGFCTLHPRPGEAARGVAGEIPALYVLPSHWRRGIGRLLCEHVLAEAHTRGFAEVVLWVLESNERARHFYDALGFRFDGKMRVFLERPEAALHELRYRRNAAQATV